MKITGIVVEYNPFHNGHIYHIQQARKKTQCDLIIAVMSGHFTQRGEPSITNKWQRTQAALENGVDLVVELPFAYASQSADYFAYGALKILNALHVDTLVYGSESNNAKELYDIALLIEEHQQDYSHLVKGYMDQGIRYPTACNNALSVLLNKQITLPNDLLAFSYIKQIVHHHYPIIPCSIARTNHFHDQSIRHQIASATSIRKAIYEHQDISHTTPMKDLDQTPVFFNDFFHLLNYELISNEHLSSYHLVDEGIDQLMIKKISTVKNMDQFVQSLTSKRYTASRIQRTILSILMNNEEGLLNIDYIRVLGMNTKGRQYLNRIKKETTIPIISNFSGIQSPLLNLELKATKLYAQALPIDQRLALIEREYKGFPIMM